MTMKIKYYCKESYCDNEICYKTWKKGNGRCYPCANKFRWSDSEYKGKVSRSISEACKGRKPNFYIDGRTKRTYYCLECDKKISIISGIYGNHICRSCARKKLKHSEETKNKLRKKMSGKGNPMFGKPAPKGSGNGKGDYYKGVWMRSSYEIAYAKWLHKNNIEWLYEPKRFDLGNSTYKPDFYLLKTNKYIEIKGYFPKKDQNKVELFRKLYPNMIIEIFRKPDLEKMGVF